MRHHSVRVIKKFHDLESDIIKVENDQEIHISRPSITCEVWPNFAINKDHNVKSLHYLWSFARGVPLNLFPSLRSVSPRLSLPLLPLEPGDRAAPFARQASRGSEK